MILTDKVDIRGLPPEGIKAVHVMVLEEIENAVKEIIRRTESGRNIYGHKFPALSKEYKKFKIRMTGSGIANLRLTGQMLDSIDAAVKRTTSAIVWQIFFTNKFAEQKAIWNSARRPFFGVSRKTLGSIQVQRNRIARYYKRKGAE